MRPILSSRILTTLLAFSWLGHAIEYDQSPGLKELYARYEANFESQSICYTYITTMTVPVESLSRISSQGLSKEIVYPAAISPPPNSIDGGPNLSSADGLSGSTFTSTQSPEFGDKSGMSTAVTNLPPASNTPQDLPPSSTSPAGANGSASGSDISTTPNSALTFHLSGSSISTDFLSDFTNDSLGPTTKTSGDVFAPTDVFSDEIDSSFGSAVTLSSHVPTSVGIFSDTVISNSFPASELVSVSTPPSLSLPQPPPVSPSNTALAPTVFDSSLYTGNGASQAAQLPSATTFSSGGTAIGVPSAISTSAAGPFTAQDGGSSVVSLSSSQLITGTILPSTPADTSQPGDVSSQGSGEGSFQSGTSQITTGGLSIGVPEIDPTANTTPQADSLDLGSSTIISLLDSQTTSTGFYPGLSISSQGSTPNLSRLSVATPLESGTGAASPTDTSSTLYESLSPSNASRVILSVRSEVPPAFAPTITITEEGTSSLGPARLVRRQTAEADNSTAGFIGNDELPNPNSCSNARLFVRSSGALRTEGVPLSVDPGVPFIDVANYTRGSITTRFDVVNGTLAWVNPFFYGGQAGFCQINGSSVYATFTSAGGPKDCTDVNLVVYRGTTLATYSIDWKMSTNISQRFSVNLA